MSWRSIIKDDSGEDNERWGGRINTPSNDRVRDRARRNQETYEERLERLADQIDEDLLSDEDKHSSGNYRILNKRAWMAELMEKYKFGVHGKPKDYTDTTGEYEQNLIDFPAWINRRGQITMDINEDLVEPLNEMLLEHTENYINDVRNNMSAVGDQWNSLISNTPGLTVKGNIGKKIIEDIFEQILIYRYLYPVLKTQENVLENILKSLENPDFPQPILPQEVLEEFFEENSEVYKGYNIHVNNYSEGFLAELLELINRKRGEKRYSIDILSQVNKGATLWTSGYIMRILKDAMRKYPSHVRKQNMIYGTLDIGEYPDCPVTISIGDFFNTGIFNSGIGDLFTSKTFLPESESQSIKLSNTGIGEKYYAGLHNKLIGEVKNYLDDVFTTEINIPTMGQGRRLWNNLMDYQGSEYLSEEELSQIIQYELNNLTFIESQKESTEVVSDLVRDLAEDFVSNLRTDLQRGKEAIVTRIISIQNILHGGLGDNTKNLAGFDRRLFSYGELGYEPPEGKTYSDPLQALTERTKVQIATEALPDTEKVQLDGFSYKLNDVEIARVYYKLVGNTASDDYELTTKEKKLLGMGDRSSVFINRIRSGLRSDRDILKNIVIVTRIDPNGKVIGAASARSDRDIMQLFNREQSRYRYKNPGDIVATGLAEDTVRRSKHAELEYHAPSERHLIRINAEIPVLFKRDNSTFNEAIQRYIAVKNINVEPSQILRTDESLDSAFSYIPSQTDASDLDAVDRKEILSFYWDNARTSTLRLQNQRGKFMRNYIYLKRIQKFVDELEEKFSDIGHNFDVNTFYKEHGFYGEKFAAKFYMDIFGATRATVGRHSRVTDTEYGRKEIHTGDPRICLYSGQLPNRRLHEDNINAICLHPGSASPLADSGAQFVLVFGNIIRLFEDRINNFSVENIIGPIPTPFEPSQHPDVRELRTPFIRSFAQGRWESKGNIAW